MRHEPSALVRDSEHPMKLMGAHTFFASAQEMKREKPLVQRNMAVFHDGSDGDGELFATAAALVQALPGVRLGFLVLYVGLEPVGFAKGSAMRANGAFRPALGFQKLTRFVGIGEVRGEDVGFHN